MDRRRFAGLAGGAGALAALALGPPRAAGADGPAPPVAGGASPFRVAVPQPALDAILARVRGFDWDAVALPDDWAFGPPRAGLRELATDWATAYDWRRAEAGLNRFEHFTAPIDGERMHFVLERGSQGPRRALVVLHGWPHSFHAMLPIVERLAHPERFGGSEGDGHDVVVPSLPGSGFSDRPSRPLGPRATAARVHALMAGTLGHDRYLVHGGDWGAHVGAWLAFDRAPHVAGLHLNGVFVRHHGAPEGSGLAGDGPAPTAEEAAAIAREREVLGGPDAAYFLLQGSRPQALGPALADSPVGLLAWLVDKFHRWSDLSARTFEEAFPRDLLLTEVTVQLVGRSAASATWIYAGHRAEGAATLPPGRRVEVPTAVAAFADPFVPPPPRSWAERAYDVVRWTTPTPGGHFPSIENPAALADDILEFGRALRG